MDRLRTQDFRTSVFRSISRREGTLPGGPSPFHIHPGWRFSMKLSRWALLVAAVPMAAGCNSLKQAVNAHKDEVASAAGKELKVDEAANLIAASQIPNEQLAGAVGAVAERWVDYTLLATAYAEDTTLAVLDLDKMT